METITYEKTYGVRRGVIKGRERWIVMSDGIPCHELHYAREDYARKEAYKFARLSHKDFIDFRGRAIHFILRAVDGVDYQL